MLLGRSGGSGFPEASADSALSGRDGEASLLLGRRPYGHSRGSASLLPVVEKVLTRGPEAAAVGLPFTSGGSKSVFSVWSPLTWDGGGGC